MRLTTALLSPVRAVAGPRPASDQPLAAERARSGGCRAAHRAPAAPDPVERSQTRRSSHGSLSAERAQARTTGSDTKAHRYSLHYRDLHVLAADEAARDPCVPRSR